MQRKHSYSAKPHRFLFLCHRTYGKSVVWIVHCWKLLFQETTYFPVQWEWQFKRYFRWIQ